VEGSTPPITGPTAARLKTLFRQLGMIETMEFFSRR
jgi:hypothetical protein